MLKNKVEEILNELEQMFPNAGCELNYRNIYELVVAVSLSAQTTDKSVNLVTPKLFEKYPTIFDLAKATPEEVKEYIKTLGLSSNKSKNAVKMAQIVVEKYNGIIPKTQEELESLPGIGRKTANVVLTEGFKIPRIPVDTHVERVSKRLGLVGDNETVLEVEKRLMELIDESRWHQGHHLLLFMGRYHCLARNPKCEKCFYKKECKYYNQTK